MHEFDELARLLAAPSIAAPEPRRESENEGQEKNEPPEHSDEQQEQHTPEEFEYIEVGDPRDGP